MATNILQCQNSQEVIKWALHHGRKKPYSLRQFSQVIGYSSDRTVGMVLSGQRFMSPDLQRRLAAKFRFTEKEKKFVQLLDLRDRKGDDDFAKMELTKEIENIRSSSEYSEIDSLQIKAIENWYYFPLLRSIQILGAKATTSDIEQFFSGLIPMKEIEVTLKSLEDLTLITQGKDRVYRLLKEGVYYNTSTDVPVASLRKAHKAQLTRAQVALDEQSVLDREFISKTVIVSKKKIDLYKKRVREVLEDLSREMIVSADDADAAIYQLSIQLYKQTR